jgi:hypothetical protein
MSASNLAETAFLNLVFKNIAWAGIGDAPGLQPSAVPGNLYIRLHSADPAEAGTGDTSEIAYTGYAPVAVARGAGFIVVGDTVGNAALVQFPICTAGNTTARYFSICAGPGEGAQIVASGILSSELSISPGIQPQFGAGALLTTVD